MEKDGKYRRSAPRSRHETGSASGSGNDLVFVRLPNSTRVTIPQSVLEKPEESLDFVGQGSFGCVYLFKDPISSQRVAIKQIRIPPASQLSQKTVLDNLEEIRVHKNLNHSNIVQYLEVYQGDHHLSIILEYAEHGSLRNRLQSLKSEGKKLNDKEVISFTRQILCGLQYLHSRPNPVIHRDLRAANILVFPDDKVKIADFGISKQLDTLASKSEFSSRVGNAYWQAPEIIEYNKAKIGRKADIWSAGVVIIEMVHINPGHPMFDMEQYQYMYRLCSKKEIPELPDFVDEKLKRVLKLCLVYDSKYRATADEVLKAIDCEDSTVSNTKRFQKWFTKKVLKR